MVSKRYQRGKEHAARAQTSPAVNGNHSHNPADPPADMSAISTLFSTISDSNKQGTSKINGLHARGNGLVIRTQGEKGEKRAPGREKNDAGGGAAQTPPPVSIGTPPSHGLNLPKVIDACESGLDKLEPDAYRYFELLGMGYTKKRAALDAGYSKSTRPFAIERTFRGRLAKMDIETQRAELRKIPGLSLSDAMFFCMGIRDGKGRGAAGAADRLRANQQIIDVLDMRPVETVNVNERVTVLGAIELLSKFRVPVRVAEGEYEEVSSSDGERACA